MIFIASTTVKTWSSLLILIPRLCEPPHILEIPALAAHHHHRHGWDYTARYHEIIKVGASHKNKNTPHAHAP
jgi:hypothetical protein